MYWNSIRRTIRSVQGGGRGRILVTLAVGWLFVFGIRLTIPTLLPYIKTDFQIGNTEAGVAITLLWFAYAAIHFPSGLLTDWFGERLVLVVSMVFGFVGLVAFVFAPSFSVFLVATMLFGLGTGLFAIPRSVLLSNTFPDNDGLAFGIAFSAGSVGAAGLPFLASLIIPEFGWRGAFGAAVPLFVVMIFATWRVIPSRQVNEPGGTSSSVRGVLGQVFEGVSTPAVLLVTSAMVLQVFVVQGLTAFLPIYLVEMKQLSPQLAAGVYTLFFATSAVMQPVNGNLADRYGGKEIMLLVMVISIVCFVVLTMVGNLFVLAALAVLMALRTSVGPIASAYLVAALPDDAVGSGFGVVRTVYMGVGATGATVIGVMADANLFNEAYYLLAGISVVGAGLFVLLPRDPDAATPLPE